MGTILVALKLYKNYTFIAVSYVEGAIEKALLQLIVPSIALITCLVHAITYLSNVFCVTNVRPKPVYNYII